MFEQDQLVVGDADGLSVKRRAERRRLTRKRHSKRRFAARLAQERVERLGRCVRRNGSPGVTAVYGELKARARRLMRRAKA